MRCSWSHWARRCCPGLEPAAATATLTLWMATWWVSEAVPLPVTALLPLPMLPLLGVSHGRGGGSFASPLVFFFLGGFLLRVGGRAAVVAAPAACPGLVRAGARPDHIVGCAMLGAAFLSMWISNTATAAMMLPIALSILAAAELVGEDRAARGFRVANHPIAFGCNIGGMGTLIGTPPNAMLAGLLQEQGIRVTFGGWMAAAVPVVIVLLGAKLAGAGETGVPGGLVGPGRRRACRARTGRAGSAVHGAVAPADTLGAVVAAGCCGPRCNGSCRASRWATRRS
ncbi:MAG: SLC13 family permease [Halofilum sp. (in: g-proteobacteria)]|nr:SLC13 family permease [Halofilum sp. (in: g-proteobacteria)]